MPIRCVAANASIRNGRLRRQETLQTLALDQRSVWSDCINGVSVIARPHDARRMPMRDAPVPRTTDGVPHVQIGVEPVPEISAELLRRVSETPGIEVHPTIVSLPGALGFWVAEDVPVARPEVIVRGREFAHIHPDGSLHASLPPALADRAVQAGWAVNHPWADQRPGWEGCVMIFTPLSSEELDLVFELVLKSYEFVTGRVVTPK